MTFDALHRLHTLLEGSGGILFFVLLLIFWGISAMAGLAKKQKQREREMLERMQTQQTIQRLETRQPAPEILRRMPNPPLRKAQVPQFQRRAAGNMPVRPPMRPQAAAQKSKRKDGRVGVAQQFKAVVPVPAPAPVVAETKAPVAARAPRAAAAVTPPSANASTIAKWLKPGTLRSQFLLTEIFQPPITLREDFERRFQ